MAKGSSKSVRSEPNRYNRIIEAIFFNHWKPGVRTFEFERIEIKSTADRLKIVLPDNLGDVIYSIRYRNSLPKRVTDTQLTGLEWIIEGAGRARYRFKLVPANRIKPNPSLAAIAIPDATPELIRAYALDDEQALLAIVRYNRLIDTFLGLTTYSLQNHLRTTVKGVGQIEIDELYIGLDRHGCHYAIPVQAKGGKDQIGVVQTGQDIAYVTQKFPGMRCRPIAAQFMADGLVAIIELMLRGDEVKIVEEKHYRLVPANQLDQTAVVSYRET
jgi:hypothetical protein